MSDAATADGSARIRAVVQHAVDEPPELTTIQLDPVASHQVRVRIAAAGVCHSDLSIVHGTVRQKLPAVLGHEGAGTVMEVGDAVSHVAVGDRVVLNWSPACRACWHCLHGEPQLCEHGADAWSKPYATLSDGAAVYPGLGTGAFAEETVVAEHAVVALPDVVALETAALLGCAVLTGVGSVVYSARVAAGESVAVFGLGGVGLSVVQGARLAGADPIIAVDRSPAKRELALSAGATEFADAAEEPVDRIRERTGGRGVDHAFECVGRSQVMREAWSATRRGGRTTVVGLGRRDDLFSLNALELFHFARTIAVSVFGGSDPDRDVPRFAHLAAAGRLDLETLVTDRVGLAGVAAAFDRMQRGEGVRTLIVPAADA